jgi:hypothetical protein
VGVRLLAVGGLALGCVLAAGFARAAEPGRAGGSTIVEFGLGRHGLVRVDPRTFRARPGRAVPLAGHAHGWSFSPDREQIVLGTDGSAELRFVDLRRMRVVGDVRIGRPGSVFATSWAGPRRVLGVVLRPGCCGLGDTTVVGVDAARRRVVWRRALGGSLQAGERFRLSLVLVLGPRGRSIGPSRLLVVGPAGRVRSASLTEIPSGLGGAGGRRISREWNPGLAVDPSAARAFVVQAGAPVAEVDLRTLRVRYHTLSERISSLATKAAEGPRRQARWLGHGLLAVAGTDSHASVGSNGSEAQWETAAGLKLIDTRRWSARTIDTRATDAVLASDTLLASSLLWDSRAGRISGSGLTGYARDGTRRFHVLGDDPISGVQPLGDRVLVGGAAGSRIFRLGALLDGRTGRELGRVRFEVTLLVGDQPFWY